MTDNPLACSRNTVDAMVNKIDARAALDRTRGRVFAACCALMVGYSLSETARRLGWPLTSMIRALRSLGVEGVES